MQTFYDLTTGRLISSGMSDTRIKPPKGQGVLSGEHDLDNTFYNVEESTIIPRTDSGAVIDQGTIQLGGSVTISNLPIPCEMLVSSGPGLVPIDDGVLIITPSSVGEYRAVLDHPHFKRAVFDFEVTE